MNPTLLVSNDNCLPQIYDLMSAVDAKLYLLAQASKNDEEASDPTGGISNLPMPGFRRRNNYFVDGENESPRHTKDNTLVCLPEDVKLAQMRQDVQVSADMTSPLEHNAAEAYGIIAPFDYTKKQPKSDVQDSAGQRISKMPKPLTEGYDSKLDTSPIRLNSYSSVYKQ